MLYIPLQGVCEENIELTVRTPQVQRARRMFNRDTPSHCRLFLGSREVVFGWLTIALRSSRTAFPPCTPGAPPESSQQISSHSWFWFCSLELGLHNKFHLSSSWGMTNEAANTYITQCLGYELLNFIFFIQHLCVVWLWERKSKNQSTITFCQLTITLLTNPI